MGHEASGKTGGERPLSKEAQNFSGAEGVDLYAAHRSFVFRLGNTDNEIYTVIWLVLFIRHRRYPAALATVLMT
jgi:hypothetical protein